MDERCCCHFRYSCCCTDLSKDNICILNGCRQRKDRICNGLSLPSEYLEMEAFRVSSCMSAPVKCLLGNFKAGLLSFMVTHGSGQPTVTPL